MEGKILDIILTEIRDLKTESKEIRKSLSDTAIKMEGIKTRVMFICALGGGAIVAAFELLANYLLGTRPS